MAYKDALEEVLDLPYLYAAKEVEGKLLNTLIKINGVLYCFLAVSELYLEVEVKEEEGLTLSKARVKSIEVWLPETGVYQNDKGDTCFIYKKPVRQWKKSFSTDYYSVLFHRNPFPLSEIVDKEKKEIWVDYNGTIYYYESPIGYVKDSMQIVCTNELFQQELTDWWKE